MNQQDRFNLSLVRAAVKPESATARAIDALERRLDVSSVNGRQGLESRRHYRLLLALLARQVVRAEAAEARLDRIRNAIR